MVLADNKLRPNHAQSILHEYGGRDKLSGIYFGVSENAVAAMSSSGLNCNERQSQYYASRLDYPVVTSTFQKQVGWFLVFGCRKKCAQVDECSG
jgi:hypothetical protein